MQKHKLTDDIIEAALQGLEARKHGIDEQIAELRAMLTGKGTASAASNASSAPAKKKGRKISPESIRRMREGQQRRWAKVRGESAPTANTGTPKPKREISAAGKKRIIEGNKRRWAAFHAQAKKSAEKK